MKTPNLNPVATSQWYAKTNRVLLVVSAMTLVVFLLANFAPGPFDKLEPISPKIISALLAVVSLVYGAIGYRILQNKSFVMSGLISFALLFVLSMWLAAETIKESPIFLAGAFSLICISYVSGLTATIISLGAWLLVTLLAATGTIDVEWSGLTPIAIGAGILAALASLQSWGGLKSIKRKGRRKSTASIATSSGGLDANLLIASISEGVVVTDNQGVITVFNQAAGQITQWDPQEAIGLDVHSVINLADEQGNPVPRNTNPFDLTIAKATATNFDKGQLINKSQQNIYVDLVASPVLSEDGSTMSVIAIFKDISKERNEEQQRAEFISTASHEMRTPVAAIEGYLALALNEKVAKIDSAARSYLEKAHTSTQHLGKLFQDLLTAAKSEDGRLTNHPEVVEVGQFLDEITEGVRFTAEKKGLLLEEDFSGNPINQKATVATNGSQTIRPVAYVHVDPERIREVITNLFDNAVKYTEEGKITIGMQISDKDVLISVADTGAGIPKDDIPHLFQKFYRVDNSATRQIGGTGLGLFICRKIVELYSGKIWAESTAGEGSVFRVALPRISAEKAQQLLKQQAATSKFGSVPATVGSTIEPTKPIATQGLPIK